MKRIVTILLFALTASVAFAQKFKQPDEFKLGEISYSIVEVNGNSKAKYDTVFLKLYKVGNSKAIATEIKSVVVKSSNKTIVEGYYNRDENSIAFYQIRPQKLAIERTYTQNTKGSLILKERTVDVPAKVAIRPNQYPIAVKRSSDPDLFEAVPPIARGTRDVVASENAVFEQVDQPAEFPGGRAAFTKYVAKNVSYPELAIENHVNGKVFAKFIIEKDGSISNIEIVRRVGYGCEEEVIRVLKKMPKWKPGMDKGIPVRTSFMLPVSFVVQE